MAEIPYYIWMLVGGLISVISFFMGFIRPISYNAFFQIMFFIGFGMIVYGFIKMKIKEKYLMEELERRRYSRGEREIEIDIDDFRQRNINRNIGNRDYINQNINQNTNQNYKYQNNSYFNSSINQYNKSHHTHNTQNSHHAHNPKTHNNIHHNNTNQQNINFVNNNNTKFHQESNIEQKRCSNCGTPLLKEHKYCPICNQKV